MGKIMKNGRSYGGGNCGGGTNVQANPLDSATIELEKILIDQTIYSVVTKAVSDLVNYYTKNQIDGIVDAIKNSRFEVVSSLPTTNIKTNVIYLVPSNSPTTNNTKYEFINTDGTSSGWEQIGNTSIDLSGYITTSDLNSALENIYNINDSVETDISNNDYFPFYDTSASGKRKTLWSNIKSVLKTYFDSLYQKTLTAGTNLAFDGNTLNASIPVLGTIDRSMIYSTSEKVVGKWTDGRPIYQKIVTYNQTSSSSTITTLSFAHNISNLLTIVDASCIWKWHEGQSDQSAGNVPYASTGNFGEQSAFWITKTNIEMFLKPAEWVVSFHFILRYTKSSDSANSYNYANENDYSTSEKVIGTWIDGNILYQKSFNLTLPTVTTQGTWAEASTSTGLTNIKVKKIWGVTENANGGVKTFPCCRIYSSDTTKIIGIDVMVNMYYEINLACSVIGFSERPCVVTIQYTKS